MIGPVTFAGGVHAVVVVAGLAKELVVCAFDSVDHASPGWRIALSRFGQVKAPMVLCRPCLALGSLDLGNSPLTQVESLGTAAVAMAHEQEIAKAEGIDLLERKVSLQMVKLQSTVESEKRWASSDEAWDWGRDENLGERAFHVLIEGPKPVT